MEMTRCLLHEKGLPKKFQAEAANTVVFLLNRLSTKALQKKTPFKAWFGYKPLSLNLKTFGCLCFSYVPQVKQDKLDKKAEVGIFVGDNNQSKTYRVNMPHANKVIVSIDVKFMEDDKWSWDAKKIRTLSSLMKILVTFLYEAPNHFLIFIIGVMWLCLSL